MTREEMNEIKENASEFVVGLFSFSSLVLKILSLIECFRARKKKNERDTAVLEEEK